MRRIGCVGASPGWMRSDISNATLFPHSIHGALIARSDNAVPRSSRLFHPRDEGPPDGVNAMSNQNHDAPHKSNTGNDKKHEAAPAMPGNRDKQETGQHEKSGADKHRDGQKAFEKSTPPAGGR